MLTRILLAIAISIAIALFLPGISFSQTHEQTRDNKVSAEEAKKSLLIKTRISMFQSIPDKWNNESAVIISSEIYLYVCCRRHGQPVP
jgi:hypothetical protein